MNQEQINNAIKYTCNQVKKGIDSGFDKIYPMANSTNNIYHATGNICWTTGFWTGMIWLAYQFTGDERFRDTAVWQSHDFDYRIKNRIVVDHHDMGFLYSPSCVAAYKITGDEIAKNAAILAAENLCGRFHKEAGFIQAWGSTDGNENYRLIIDCLLNIPLLYWASKVTDDDKYSKIATTHLHTALDTVIRDDYTTFHTYYFDRKTNLPDHGETHQGYSNDSIWARGQAWGIYGIALSYKNTGDTSLIEKFVNVTNVFIDHLPSDNVPAWDMIFTDTKTQKDTSAAAVAVCGILEMARLCDFEEEEYFIQKANEMMDALSNYYVTDIEPKSTGILSHGVYAYPQGLGIDECNLWGDYYYMEALMLMNNPQWESFWC